jgi:flagellar biosynthesis component FlhA
MQFSEDDLRAALKRKDPGPEFTQQVMARLNQPAAKTKAPGRVTRSGLSSWLAMFRIGPALAAAAVAVLLLVGAWIGYQSYRQHEQQAKAIQQRRELEEKQAEQQAILAVRITSEKLNHVFQKVNSEAPQTDRIRRQRL